MVAKPLLLGLAFGAGCYIAKVLLNSPLMKDIMEAAEKSAGEKLRPSA